MLGLNDQQYSTVTELKTINKNRNSHHSEYWVYTVYTLQSLYNNLDQSIRKVSYLGLSSINSVCGGLLLFVKHRTLILPSIVLIQQTPKKLFSHLLSPSNMCI